MHVDALAIPDIKLVTPEFRRDHRGYFVETYNRAAFAAIGIDTEFDRDNASLSHRSGTVRGLHFQIPPYACDKLVRVLEGRIFDVAVDIRHGSATFGRHVAVELDARTGAQMLVPRGFAHGFCTLDDDTLVAYKVSGPYAPDHDMGILWHDPALAIDWPVTPDAAITSARDTEMPPLAETPAWFRLEA